MGIVAATDLSETGNHAVEEAISLSRHSGMDVTIFHASAIVESVDYASWMPSTVVGWVEARKQAFADAREKIGELHRRYSSAALPVSQVVVDEFPDTGIADYVRENPTELVVVSSSGRTGLRRILLGSTAAKMIRNLGEHRVLVAKGSNVFQGESLRVLVPVDFSDGNQKLIDELLWLEDKFSLKLAVTLFHAVRPMWQWNHMYGNTEEALVQRIQEKGIGLAKEWQQKLKGTVTFEVATQAPQKSIVGQLEQRPIDLCVLGRHGFGGLKRGLLGSVAEYVVRHSPVSVLLSAE